MNDRKRSTFNLKIVSILVAKETTSSQLVGIVIEIIMSMFHFRLVLYTRSWISKKVSEWAFRKKI